MRYRKKQTEEVALSLAPLLPFLLPSKMHKADKRPEEGMSVAVMDVTIPQSSYVHKAAMFRICQIHFLHNQ